MCFNHFLVESAHNKKSTYNILWQTCLSFCQGPKRHNADLRLHKQASSALGLFEKDTRIFSSFFYLKFIAVLMKAGEGLDSLSSRLAAIREQNRVWRCSTFTCRQCSLPLLRRTLLRSVTFCARIYHHTFNDHHHEW